MHQAEIIWPRDALPHGTALNGYCIDAVIGRGGFGITYRATDAIDQVFAVKECFPKQFAVRQGSHVLPSDHAATEPFNECLKRFGGEARALRQLATIGAAGEGVVKVATFFAANGTAYVVMEFLGGQSLDSVIKARPGGIAAAQLDFLLPRLLHAVGCVHTAGLLHRDIKPANIILRPDGRPVLIDFGAARTSSQGRTVTFTQIFSEGYAPIEQFAGTRQGPFSDIYALGATLYRAIGGSAVDSFTRHQALLRGKKDPQPPATAIGAGRYAPSLLSAIDAAMVVAPEDRPQSVAELLALLGAPADSDETRVPPRAASPAPAEATILHPETEMRPAAAGPAPPKPHPQALDQARRTGWRLPFAMGLTAITAICCIVGYLVYVNQPPNRHSEPGQPPRQTANAATVPPHAAAAPAAPAPAAPAASAAQQARLAGRATAAHALTVLANLGWHESDFLSRFNTTTAQAEAEFRYGSYENARRDFSEADTRLFAATDKFLHNQCAAFARLARARLRAGDLEASQTALNNAKQIKLQLAAWQAAAVTPDQPLRGDLSVSPVDAMPMSEAQARATLADLGLRVPNFLSRIDSYNGAGDPARRDEYIRLELHQTLQQKSAEYAAAAQREMHDGDLTDAQSALNTAKRIQQAELDFP